LKLTRLGEPELVEAIGRDFGRKGKGLELGIGDDAAVLGFGSRKGERLLLTTDLLVEDVDFRRSIHPPFLLGRKSLSVNLSDIAAMGGRPRFALLGLALPRRSSPEWVNAFFRGFRSVVQEAGLLLIGGDLSAASKIVISVTVVGAARQVVRRGGARPGDYLFVSGSLGDAAAGRRLLEKKGRSDPARRAGRLERAFLDPRPPLELGRQLARQGLASAMIDLSDGLSVDVRHICRESRVGAEVWAESIPLSKDIRKYFSSALPLALHGGEDFELLFSVPQNRLKSLLRLGRRHPLYPIGRITRGREAVLVGPGGRRSPLPARGWQHFKR
jgi:thiamine-monophosphate kinase